MRGILDQEGVEGGRVGENVHNGGEEKRGMNMQDSRVKIFSKDLPRIVILF